MQRTRPVAVGLAITFLCSVCVAQERRPLTLSKTRQSLVSFHQADNPMDSADLAPSPFEPPYITNTNNAIAPTTNETGRPVTVPQPHVGQPSSNFGRVPEEVGYAPSRGERPNPLLDLMTDDPCGYDVWYCYWCTRAAAHDRKHHYVHSHAPHGYHGAQGSGHNCNGVDGRYCFVPRPYSMGPQPVCLAPQPVGYFAGPIGQPIYPVGFSPMGVPATAQIPAGNYSR